MAYPGDGRLSVSTCGGRGSGIDRVVDDPFYGFKEVRSMSASMAPASRGCSSWKIACSG